MNNDDIRTSDSTDAKVTQDLIETLVDGQEGYASAADKLSSDERPDLAARFAERSAERATMAEELRMMAARYGDTVDSDGSIAAAAHRGWMSVKDAVTGTNADAIVNTAITGEDHAIGEYERALDAEISDELRQTVQRQLASIRAAREELDGVTA